MSDNLCQQMQGDRRMPNLSEFKTGLDDYLTDPRARPFVCTGSPMECRSFIVGINAATPLEPFSCYWSDETGFNRKKFEADYKKVKSRRGNRPVIEAIAAYIKPCLETNLYAIPTKKAKDLTEDDRRHPVICYLFRAIRPELVFVHSKAAIRFFEEETGCRSFTSEVTRTRWQEHDFWLFGRPGVLWTLGSHAPALGAKLAMNLD